MRIILFIRNMAAGPIAERNQGNNNDSSVFYFNIEICNSLQC